jgi:HPt (histidine-containing phosphotransfer) domain-containing protein
VKIDGLITLFLAEAAGHLVRIGTYRAGNDFEKIAGEAHIIVSTSGNIGAMQLSALARTLEHKCKEKQFHLVDGLIAELKAATQAVVSELDAWLAVRRSGSEKSIARTYGSASG